MNTYKKREKFNLQAKIQELNLDPRVEKVLESSRPLTNTSLLTLSENIEFIDNVINMTSRRVMSLDACAFRFAAATECVSTIADPWSRAVITGAAHRVYTGHFSDQQAYQVLCLAAGSCLRAPAAEPFRLVLSILTKAGFRPMQSEDPERIHVDVGLPPKRWQALADVYGSLEEVKGSQIVECLAVGLGCHLLGGKVTRNEASRLFKSARPWRTSSPIPQLLRGETKC